MRLSTSFLFASSVALSVFQGLVNSTELLQIATSADNVVTLNEAAITLADETAARSFISSIRSVAAISTAVAVTASTGDVPTAATPLANGQTITVASVPAGITVAVGGTPAKDAEIINFETITTVDEVVTIKISDTRSFTIEVDDVSKATALKDSYKKGFVNFSFAFSAGGIKDVAANQPNTFDKTFVNGDSAIRVRCVAVGSDNIVRVTVLNYNGTFLQRLGKNTAAVVVGLVLVWLVLALGCMMIVRFFDPVGFQIGITESVILSPLKNMFALDDETLLPHIHDALTAADKEAVMSGLIDSNATNAGEEVIGEATVAGSDASTMSMGVAALVAFLVPFLL